jgi:hypothetical protein
VSLIGSNEDLLAKSGGSNGFSLHGDFQTARGPDELDGTAGHDEEWWADPRFGKELAGLDPPLGHPALLGDGRKVQGGTPMDLGKMVHVIRAQGFPSGHGIPGEGLKPGYPCPQRYGEPVSGPTSEGEGHHPATPSTVSEKFDGSKIFSLHIPMGS